MADKCRICKKPFTGRDEIWGAHLWIYENQCAEGESDEIGFEPNEAVIEFEAHPDCMKSMVRDVGQKLDVPLSDEGWPEEE